MQLTEEILSPREQLIKDINNVSKWAARAISVTIREDYGLVDYSLSQMERRLVDARDTLAKIQNPESTGG